MAIDRIRPAGRSTLRWHGAALATWALVVGLLVDLLLLHGLHVHTMALRYAAGAGAMYFFGFLLGGWWYALWCARRDRRIEAFLQHATPAERADYAAGRKKKSEYGEWLDGLPDLGAMDDPVSIVLGLIGLALAAVGLFLLASWLPLLAADALAGYLAEIVLEFVIGAAFYRHVAKPRPLDAYWGFMLRRTGLVGLLVIVLAGAAGHVVQGFTPDARTLGQVLRSSR